MEKSTIQKIILWSAIAVLVALIAYGGYRVYLWTGTISDKINFNTGLSNIDLSSLFSMSGDTNIDVSLTITNANNFSITVSNLFLQMFYNGQLAVYTTQPQPPEASDSFVIPAIAADGTVGSVNVIHNITIVKATAFPLITNYISKTPSQLTYSVKTTLWNIIPFTYTGTETIQH